MFRRLPDSSLARRAIELTIDGTPVPAPGGQIYRAITTTPVSDRAVLGDDYWRGEPLVAKFRQSPARPLFDTTLWAIERDDSGFMLGLSSAGRARFLHARHLILATGA